MERDGWVVKIEPLTCTFASGTRLSRDSESLLVVRGSSVHRARLSVIEEEEGQMPWCRLVARPLRARP